MKLRKAWGEVAPVASDLVAHFEAQGLLLRLVVRFEGERRCWRS